MIASVLATTYNQSVDLALYLRTLSAQTVQDFEVIIADDGSRPDTRAVIDGFKARHFGERLVHVWHEDTGYRKCRILNLAVQKAKADWLIFTDSDLIVHPRFVEDHLSYASRNTLFMGRRVDLGPEVSEWVRRNGDALFSHRFWWEVLRSARSGTRGLKRALRLGNPWLARLMRADRVPDLLGSNFSVDRELLYRVNGFDESREHYWGEDGDLFIRLRNAGARIFGRKSFAVQFHLWHRLREPQPGAQADYLHALTDRTYVRCRDGLAKS